jgi:2-C-methyl-D-erythritol 2,4-cyclodiphosphate synthase
MSTRVGIGYDSHRLTAGRRLVIGGVEIPFDRGLEGHSDADVLAHAVTDAVLGAAGAGDIGTHYPPTDDRWRDADSIELLRAAIAGLPGRVVNVDATVICERPPIGPHRAEIESRLSAALGAPVSVKATTNEGLGAIGREEGIAAIAVAAFEPDDDTDR